MKQIDVGTVTENDVAEHAADRHRQQSRDAVDTNALGAPPGGQEVGGLGHERGEERRFGDPVGGAALYAVAWKEQSDNLPFNETEITRQVTDESGAFRFPHVPMGKFKMLVKSVAYAPLVSDWVLSGTEDAQFVLKEGGSIAGRVVLGRCSSVWFGVEIDAGEATIEIGEQTNVQDNSRLYAGKPGEDIRIGPRVVIGHNVRIFPSSIEEGAIIGMEAVIGKGTLVRAGGCVAAGSVTEPGTEVAAGQVWSGRPARAARVLTDRNREGFARAVRVYVEYSGNYLAGGAEARRSAGAR